MANMQIVAVKNVEPQYVEMRVPLYSYGCERKMKNTLSHLKGIYSVSVDYEQQKVTVWGICNKYDVLTTVRSKRRAARFWNPRDDDDVVQEAVEMDEGVTRMRKLNSKAASLAIISLVRARSLSFKLSVKKVFDRSFSF